MRGNTGKYAFSLSSTPQNAWSGANGSFSGSHVKQSSRQQPSCLVTTHTTYLPHRRSRTPSLLLLRLRFSTRPATRPRSEHTKVSVCLRLSLSLWCKRTAQRNAGTLCLFRSTVGFEADGEQNRTSLEETRTKSIVS